jgi:threonine synthase
MGLPIEEIVLAHNVNRAVPDFLATGRWRPRRSVQTLATAMDVGNPSNIERLTWSYPEMESLRHSLSADVVNDDGIRSRIREDCRNYGRVWCPHSAVAAEVYSRMPEARKRARHWVLVATAHPAKFREIVEPVTGCAIEVPPQLLSLLRAPNFSIDMEARLENLTQIVLAS